MIFFFSSKVIIAFPAMINPIIQITLPPAVILVFMKPVNILITVAIIPQIQIIIKAPNLFQGFLKKEKHIPRGHTSP